MKQVPEGSQVEVGELIAITVEKGMDWKNIVIPKITKPTTAPGVAPEAVPTAPPVGVPAPSVATPPAPSGQYAYKKIVINFEL